MSRPTKLVPKFPGASAQKANVEALEPESPQALATRLYGADLATIRRLGLRGEDLEGKLPGISESKLFRSEGRLPSPLVLFLGVVPLREFGYEEIRSFGRNVLTSLVDSAPTIHHLALTIHGPGYGLDEIEAFESQIAGLLDALASRGFPTGLERISIVERNESRAKRLKLALSRLLPKGKVELAGSGALQNAESYTDLLRFTGEASVNKPHIFVAMPFAEEMDDTFHYGIQGAVNAAGFLCERADLSSFTGDVVEWVKNRIASAVLVIADLSTANPNVYLEVGYAWGCGRPTVLLVKDTAELKFDGRTFVVQSNSYREKSDLG